MEKGGKTLTVREVLRRVISFLEGKGVHNPRLDAEVLLAHVLRVRRVDLYMEPERPLRQSECEALRDLVKRRAAFEPVAYLVGHREFYGLDLETPKGVFIPRPETETLVDGVLEWLRGRGSGQIFVADVGTGSGAIACAIASRDPRVFVVATDISRKALEVARRNAHKLGLSERVQCLQCDMLSGIGAIDVVVSNPPYVGEDERHLLDRGVAEYEPYEALFGGPEGLGPTAKLLSEAQGCIRRGGALFIEVGSRRHREFVERTLYEAGPFCDIVALRDPQGFVRGYRATVGPGEGRNG